VGPQLPNGYNPPLREEEFVFSVNLCLVRNLQFSYMVVFVFVFVFVFVCVFVYIAIMAEAR
jgi:hypothetical protein